MDDQKKLHRNATERVFREYLNQQYDETWNRLKGSFLPDRSFCCERQRKRHREIPPLPTLSESDPPEQENEECCLKDFKISRYQYSHLLYP